ncbi:MAG: hypothetical protein LBL83_11435, partial [Clostridiales bacterium]|nr:hypothetical protein [Clostridiales bacterium]
MKLKMIASLFSRYRQLTLYSAPNDEQWIGNGAAIYSLRGMPRLTPEIVLRVFDVPPDKHSKWICREDSLPAAIQFTDSAYGETDIEPLKTSIGWFGNSYWLFPDGRSIYSVNGDYIKPLLDEPDYLTF